MCQLLSTCKKQMPLHELCWHMLMNLRQHDLTTAGQCLAILDEQCPHFQIPIIDMEEGAFVNPNIYM
jgi:hypothetical protein